MATTLSTPTTSAPAPASDSNVKYDRQIRIWGDEGQRALQSTSICVIDASSTATEILKNLVLPGISSFTIIDGQQVTPQDVATNFFLTTPNINKSTRCKNQNRAHAIVEAMYTLNESVTGSYIPVDASTFLNSESSTRAFLQAFSFVILTQRSRHDIVTKYVSQTCALLKIPLLYVRSYGQCALIRLQTMEHCVLNSHTEDLSPDLRLHDPFPQLLQFVKHKFDVDNNRNNKTNGNNDENDENDEGHIPFVCILVRAVEMFKQKYSGRLPSTRKEKDEFAQLVQNSKSKTCPPDAQNYVEAARYAHLRLCHASAKEIPSSVTNMLNAAMSHHTNNNNNNNNDNEKQQRPDIMTTTVSTTTSNAMTECDEFNNNINTSSIVGEKRARQRCCDSTLPQPIYLDGVLKQTQNINIQHHATSVSLAHDRARWWMCAKAVAKFVETYGYLPLSGSIPDMTSNTSLYIQLQQIYSQRAQQEFESVLQYLPVSYNNSISKEYVRNFCKLVRDMRVLQTRRFDEELNQPEKSSFANVVRDEGAYDESHVANCASPIYLILRAVDRFHQEFARLPSNIQEDSYRLCTLVAQEGEKLGLSNSQANWRDYIHEFIRYGGVEIHSVVALIGGIAAQEIIKVITGQYIPIEDTLVFNMANMTSVTFRA